MTETLRAELRQLRTLILHPRDREGDGLLRQVQRLQCPVELIWPVDRPLPKPDVVFCLLRRETRHLLEQWTFEAAAAVIAILDPDDGLVPQFLHDVTPHAVLPKPVGPAAVLPTLIVARQIARYQRRLLAKTAKLEETLRLFRMVEQAKSVLMAKRRLDEPKAYAYLREQAMRKRLPIGAIASAIVESHNLLAGDQD